MSPEFVASVEQVALTILRTEYGLGWQDMSRADRRVLAGLVYRFIQRLTVEACSVASVKGYFDATCFTFASRKNLRMFKRMSRLLEASQSVRIDDVHL